MIAFGFRVDYSFHAKIVKTSNKELLAFFNVNNFYEIKIDGENFYVISQRLNLWCFKYLFPHLTCVILKYSVVNDKYVVDDIIATNILSSGLEVNSSYDFLPERY